MYGRGNNSEYIYLMCERDLCVRVCTCDLLWLIVAHWKHNYFAFSFLESFVGIPFLSLDRRVNPKLRLMDLAQGADLGVPQIFKSTSFVNVAKPQVDEIILAARDYMETKVHNIMEKEIVDLCKNGHEECSIWAASGECEKNDKCKYTEFFLERSDEWVSAFSRIATQLRSSIPLYTHRSGLQSYYSFCAGCLCPLDSLTLLDMKKNCGPACRSCSYMTVEGRCPLDPNAKHAWAPGDLDKMFTKLTSEPYLSEYEVEILSSPHWDESETNIKATNGKGLPWIITMENVVTEEEALRLIELGAVEGYQRSAE
jgi:hypothetical protein